MFRADRMFPEEFAPLIVKVASHHWLLAQKKFPVSSRKTLSV